MKPEPRSTNVVCTLCGLDWEKHGPKPTAEKCVELLKIELKKPRQYGQISGTSWSGPYYGTWTNAA